MKNSVIVSFIKFFEGCVVSKKIKRANNWLQFITFLLSVVFYLMFINIFTYIDNNDVSISIEICAIVMYIGLVMSFMYFRESLISSVLFPNEYFLMKSIKNYLGKIFRDIYLSDINEEKILNHISTLSYYIANLYDLQRIKAVNRKNLSSISATNKCSKLACNEFLYFLNVKINVDKFRDYTLIDLKSNQIANIVYNLFEMEYKLSKNEIDDEIYESINKFLNYENGKNFIKDYIIYNNFSSFDDYHVDEWFLYNKLDLPVIKQTSFYRRHIKDKNKQYYSKKNIQETNSKSKKNEKKSYLSWIDTI